MNFRTKTTLLHALLVLWTSLPTIALGDEACYGEHGPLGDDQLGAVGESRRSLSTPPSDVQIYTADDSRYCPTRVPPATREYDPRTLPDDRTVYRVGSRRWNLEWEKKFGAWVEKEVDTHFFARYGIATDCADAALAVRMIFARIHHLPMVIAAGEKTFSFTSDAYGRLPTQRIWDETNWKSALKTDQRFRAFLDDVKTDVGTANLGQSTYPIELSSCVRPGKLSEHFLPGTVLLEDHHARFVWKIDTTARQQPLTQLSSSMPSEVRELSQGIVYMHWPTEGHGVRKWQWAVNCGHAFRLTDARKMPGYSREQYKPTTYTLGFQLNALTPGKRGPADRAYANRRHAELKHKLQVRVDLVRQAQAELNKNPHAFDDAKSALYDQYSTPALDDAIWASYRSYKKDLWESPVWDYANDRMDDEQIEVEPGKRVSIREAVESIGESDPKLPIDKRWSTDHTISRNRVQTERAIDRISDQVAELRRKTKETIAHLSFAEYLYWKVSGYPLPVEQELKAAESSLEKLKRRHSARSLTN